MGVSTKRRLGGGIYSFKMWMLCMSRMVGRYLKTKTKNKCAQYTNICCSFFTLNWTKAPFFRVIVVGAGSAPQQMVVTAFCCALVVPFVVVLKGQSAGHAMSISQQGVDVCKRADGQDLLRI